MSVTSLIYLSFLSLLTLPSLSHAAASCYYPDGTEASQDIPCYPDRGISVCCGLNWACLPNGLCAVTANVVGNGPPSPYARGSCTDKTWATTACPQFCVTTESMRSSGNSMKACDGSADTFCCLIGDSACDCTGANITTVAGGVVPFTTIGTEGTSTSSSSSSTPASSTSSSSISSLISTTIPATSSTPSPTTATASPSPSSSTTSSASLSAGAKAGIGVGIPAGALILAGLGYLLWRDRERGKKMKELLGQIGNGAYGQMGQYSESPEHAHHGEVRPVQHAQYMPTYELGFGEQFEIGASN